MPGQKIEQGGDAPGNARGLLVGRFQPLHLGHLDIILGAAKQVGTLYLGIGSSNKPLDESNPFTVEERREMIEKSLDSRTLSRVKIFAVPDADDHREWIKCIEKMIPGYDVVFTADAMTARLHRERGIRVVEPEMISRDTLSGTAIRFMMQRGDAGYLELVPAGAASVLERINAPGRLAKFKL